MKENNIRILSIEDSDDDYYLLERKLSKSFFLFTITRVQEEQEFRNAMKDFDPDVILSDFSLPGFSGMAALDIAQKEYPHIPFVFVSGMIGEELAVEGLKRGAADYVLKSNLEKLEPAITRVLKEAEEKWRRKEAERKLLLKHQELKSFVYRISHDIRGPLCTIKGTVNLMREEKAQDTATYLGLIEEVLSKMDGVVLNLSSFQFLYEDELTISPINSQKLVKDIVKRLGMVKDFGKIKLDIDIKGKELFFSDRELVDAVLYNLLHNAVIFSDKYKEEQKINFRINPMDEQLEIYVEDNGIGILSDVQNKIFEMFFKGSSYSKGAGLGLYIAKTAVDKLQGTIKISSEKNIGTKAMVKIPLASM